jgi:Tfp pilus assembly protein PilX
MFGKFLKDESGMALGLAVIMVVLIGVMGAGLLVFVRNDLEAVVEVNQGQRAFETAEAGLQAASRQILSNATETIYDSDTTGNSDWAYVGGPGGPGKDLTFNGNTVNVKIQYLLPSTTSSQIADANYAPELVTEGTDYPEPKDYFKVIAEGKAGDARRKIEGIFLTADIGVPKAYYTPGNVTISGTACIDSVSVFALGNVTFNGTGGCTLADGSKSHMKGTDLAYGNWYSPPFNTTARTDPTWGKAAGVGAVGTISGSTKLGTRDFHGGLTNPTNPRFIQKNPPAGTQSSGEISFPFDYALPDTDFLRDIAKANGTYYEVSGGTVSMSSWPAGSDSSTVVFYKFTSTSANTLQWDVPGTCSDNPPKQGILVVENGNFTTQPNKALFRGAVIVRGGEVADGTSDDTGKTCLEGFINAEGEIKIAGNVTPLSTEAAVTRPGFYGVKTWSWRELYE